MVSLSVGMKIGALGASAVIAALETLAGAAVDGLRDMSEEDTCRVIDGAYLTTRSGRCHIAIEGEMLLLGPKGGTVEDVRHLRDATISSRRNQVSIITDIESQALQLEFGNPEEAANWARRLQAVSVGGFDVQEDHQAVVQPCVQSSEPAQRNVAARSCGPAQRNVARHSFSGHVGRVSQLASTA